jgi:hypothetical protein
MFFIFGSRSTTKQIGQVLCGCPRCGRNTVHAALVCASSITFFFIPVIPLGKVYQIGCNLCGLRHRSTGELKDQLVHLERTGTVPQPSALPARG